MVEIVKVKTGSMYEEKDSYSRIVMVDNQIFVANTAGIDYKTREISADPGMQARKALQNIEGALKAVEASLADIVRVVAHVPDRVNAPAVAAVLGEVFKGIDPALTFANTPLARDDLKVEFEVTAIRGASGQAKYVRISL